MKLKKDNVKLYVQFPIEIFETTLTRQNDQKDEFHWHTYFEITYIESGSATYFVGEKTFEVQAGDFVIFNHLEPHGWAIDGEKMKVLVVVFSGSFISERVGDFDYEYLEPFIERGSNFRNHIPKEDAVGALMATLFVELRKEWEERETGYRLMIKADVLKLLTLLTRYYTREQISDESLSEKKSGMKRLEDVLTHMYDHFCEKITLEDLAKLCYMSPTYFSAYFKKVMGSTVSEYLAGIRIREVQRQLKNTDVGVVEAALSCGFHNISNFYRIYKKYTGKNPGDERKQN